MKKLSLTLLLSMPLMAAGSNCDEISAGIAEKIRNNGVPAANFELKLIPTEKQEQQTEGKIVGTCNGGQQKIVYLRSDAVQSSPTVSNTEVKAEVKNEVETATDTNIDNDVDTDTEENIAVETDSNGSESRYSQDESVSNPENSDPIDDANSLDSSDSSDSFNNKTETTEPTEDEADE